MQKAYDHNASEDNIYADWEASGAMRADNGSDKKPFTIVLPPPNVTGTLHLGHAAMLAIEDILIRYKKMRGYEALWVPGTDHAAIATENVVIKHLGLNKREEMGREDFLKEARKFATEKHDTIVGQCKKMGSWLDWSREAYTFDETRNHAVTTMFKMLYEDGLIERGYRMINWSVGAQSVLADDELEWEDRGEPFYYIRCGEFIIGTVRSETKCADSPLVVHPEGKYARVKFIPTHGAEETMIFAKVLFDDKERLTKLFNLLEGKFELIEVIKGKDLEGQEFEYDTYAGKRKFVVLADEVIDMEKGTGAMTISVNHATDDYDLAQRHGLKEYYIEKLNFEGNMTAIAGPCAGMPVAKARKESGKIMKQMGLLVGQDNNYQHRVPLCYRSGSVVEPMISPQWFIMVEKEFTDKFTGAPTTLKKQMQEAVRGGHIKIIPERFEKLYFHWIDNLRDWCISRQIWWGHRIPVWYDQQDNIAAVGKIDNPDPTWRQDEDTLDTWFSSALWPFSTLGWPDENSDFDKFYPNDVLETGWDILFFWVARMIMFGRYATGKYPFHTVYLHGLVCDEHGKKMSKSKGNGIDPLEVIEEVGADAVRLSLVIGTSPGNPIPLGKNKIKGYRNFVNKLWNAGRFIQMQEEAGEQEGRRAGESTPQLPSFSAPRLESPSLADKWILSRLSRVAKEVSNNLEKYEISAAGDTIYHFVWDEFCDWYIEASKVELNSETLKYVYGEILKLTHPLCPFVTESIWKELFETEGSIMDHEYPTPNFEDEQVEQTFTTVQNLVTEIRRIRAEKKLNPKDKIEAKIKSSSSEIQTTGELLKVLGNLSEIEIGSNVTKPEKAVISAVDGHDLYVEIPFDEDAEKSRLGKEIEQLRQKIAALEGRLSNPSYTEKAPAALVQQTKDELSQAKESLGKMEAEFKSIS